LVALSLPMAAVAQMAQTSKWVNLRAGPAPDYPLVAQLPPATPLSVQGCVSDFSWCDVITPDQLRGWVYAGNLLYPYQYSQVPLLAYGPIIGLPIITFSIGPYWYRHYRNRPWYGEEPRWANRPPHVRPPRERPPEVRPPGVRPSPPSGRPPGERPPGGRQPGERPPSARQPGERPPGARPPEVRPPQTRPPGAQLPERPGRPPNGAPPNFERPGRPPDAGRPGQRPPGERSPGDRQPGARPPQGQAPGAQQRVRPGGPSGPERPNANDRREQR
jgi:uncharacterized protein YraI